VIPSVTAPRDTNLSDAADYNRFQYFLWIMPIIRIQLW